MFSRQKSLLVCLGLVAIIISAVTALAQGPGAATQVYGQPDFTSNGPNRLGPAGPETLRYPLGITLDASGGMYLADRDNHRVLYFASDGDASADRVYGQHGSFIDHVVNNDGTGNSAPPSANGLAAPTAVALDSAGGLYVADRDNHRVLYYAPDGDTTADRIYGQYGNYAGFMINNDGAHVYGEPTPDNFGAYILGLALDGDGGLYVADSGNHRVLYFANDGDTTADRVYGQHDDFTTGVQNNDGTGRKGTPSARSLKFPRGLAVDSAGGLYVSDRENNRVLYFANDGDTTADRVYGQYGDFAINVPSNDGSGGSGAASADNLAFPKSVAVDGAGGLYIADSMQHRVLYFAPDGDTTADAVYGQFGSFTTSAVNNDGSSVSGAPSAENLSLPQGLVVSADGLLYVADTGNDRVLVLPAMPLP